MRASTAASLVGAAVLSTLVYPIVGLRLRGDAAGRRPRRSRSPAWPAARREPRPGPAPLPARPPLARLGDVGAGARRERRRGRRSRSRCRSLDEHLREGGSAPIAAAAAQQIFGALAAGMITFTGIIFSAVFVAAQIQTSSYSPRLAARLRRDPVVIAGLALPTATATYALFALAAIGARRATGRAATSPPW